ncbi:MAG: hypothetical protein SAK29_21295 [Scytonema sp. PMC 1069.18]|nr:hypothetical protein [Scytonema sp. PMC 1069.18]MEC4882060.1 hypothetical protein [Scytonema sp. PMC 1070.18]
MSNLKDMSVAELKKYLSSHRDNDEAFSAALAELMSRNRKAVRYPANLPLTEMEKIIKKKLNRTNDED